MLDGNYMCEHHPELVKYINFCDYSLLDLGLILLGTIFWVIVYVIIIRNSIKSKFVEMPVMAGIANIAWEFTWSFLLHTDLGLVFVWGLRVWFLLDIGILIQIFRYGDKQFLALPLKQSHRWITVLALPVWVVSFYLFYHEGYDSSMGSSSAIFITVLMAGLYITLNLTRKTTAELSKAVAWCKGLGNLFMVVFIINHFKEARLIWLMGIVSIVLDAWYIYLLLLRRRFERKHPELLRAPGHIGAPGDAGPEHSDVSTRQPQQPL